MDPGWPRERKQRASDIHAQSHQVTMNPRRSVCRTRARVTSPDRARQGGIRYSALRRRASQPVIVAAGRHAQHAAHRPDTVRRMVRLHELERPLDVEPYVFCANQATAFPMISSSSWNRRLSRRSWRNSSRSAVVRPSERRPSSRSACSTQ